MSFGISRITAIYNFNKSIMNESVRKYPNESDELNYTILKENFNDYQKGFEIQSPQKQFIKWQTTYKALEKHPDIIFDEIPNRSKIARFRYPTRVGNILLQHFGFYFDSINIYQPVFYFFSECYDKAGTDQNYIDLKNKLNSDIGIDMNCFNDESGSQKQLNYDLGEISLKLIHPYESNWAANRLCTLMWFQNKEAYINLITNEDY